jgi:outer membrane lipopolysaccharide assembly protein LptE/RlpB
MTRRFIGLCTAALMVASCGYRLRGTGSYLPPHIKRISIPMFKNMTTRYELDLKLTRAVIDEMTARAKVDVLPEAGRADAVLLGEVLGFRVYPIAFSGEAAADRYNITITVRIVLRDLVNNKVLFSNPAFSYVMEYEVPEGADFESLETEAIGKASEEFARTIVVNILEGF